MKAICIQLVKALLESDSNATALAEKLNVSSRSIKTYVKEINSEYENAILSSRNGYEIQKETGIKILESLTNDLPQTSNERVYYIITKLLNHSYTLPINVYDLCDELYISSSTIKNDLLKVKRKLSKFDLQLVSKGDFISAEGLEKNKRHLLSSILYEESSVNFVSFDALKKVFVDIDIDFIKNCILDTLNKYHYFVNDYSLTNLILHIAISIDRIRNRNLNNSSQYAFPLVKFHEYEVAKEIADVLEKKFDVVFNTDEKIELALLIVSRATAVDYNNVNGSTIAEYVGDDCYDLVIRLVTSLEAFYHISLRDDEFLVRFALHIKNLLVRVRNNYQSKNPLAEGIKRSCPLIYDASVNMANEIRTFTGITINADEIAYIAFHIGSALETQQELKVKIKAVYYCPNYYDHNNRVVESLKKHLGEEMIVTNIVTDESQLIDLRDVDLIITSIPISRILPIKSVTISMFANENDINKLLRVIHDTRKEIERNSFKTRLIQLLDPRLFEVNKDIRDYQSCITYMCNKLTRYNYVDNAFRGEVMERESISSTAFSNFAIPHSMKMNAHKTGIAVLINPDGIEWNQQNVSIVIMMFFNKNERFIFNELYEPMTMILTETENTSRLIHTHDYNEFIETMAMMI